jgi:hypothetical protein
MVFRIGPHFDALEMQRRLNAEGLNRILYWHDEHIEGRKNQKMLWSFASSFEVIYGHICAANPQLLQSATEIVVSWARLSLERKEWQAFTRPLDEKELLQQYYLDVGKVFEKSFSSRPEAWITAHNALFFYEWLRAGTLDYGATQIMLAEDMGDVSLLQGIWGLDTLMPLSAWPQIIATTQELNPAEEKRKLMAGDRIALLLAEDPSQLHDPKSPVRKKARSYMRGNMSQNWLARGLATTAADWLRTFEWREGQSGLSPREVMLRAYAYMPEVEAPANIAAEVASLRKIPI